MASRYLNKRLPQLREPRRRHAGKLVLYRPEVVANKVLRPQQIPTEPLMPHAFQKHQRTQGERPHSIYHVDAGVGRRNKLPMSLQQVSEDLDNPKLRQRSASHVLQTAAPLARSPAHRSAAH